MEAYYLRFYRSVLRIAACSISKAKMGPGERAGKKVRTPLGLHFTALQHCIPAIQHKNARLINSIATTI